MTRFGTEAAPKTGSGGSPFAAATAFAAVTALVHSRLRASAALTSAR
jgi:hypothetical protein